MSGPTSKGCVAALHMMKDLQLKAVEAFKTIKHVLLSSSVVISSDDGKSEDSDSDGVPVTHHQGTERGQSQARLAELGESPSNRDAVFVLWTYPSTFIFTVAVRR